MDLQLEGKRALVTGSTAGIGFAAALRLAGEGATVIINSRTRARVEEAVRRVQSEVAGAQVSGVAADLSSVEGVTMLTARAPELEHIGQLFIAHLIGNGKGSRSRR